LSRALTAGSDRVGRIALPLDPSRNATIRLRLSGTGYTTTTTRLH